MEASRPEVAYTRIYTIRGLQRIPLVTRMFSSSVYSAVTQLLAYDINLNRNWKNGGRKPEVVITLKRKEMSERFQRLYN